MFSVAGSLHWSVFSLFSPLPWYLHWCSWTYICIFLIHFKPLGISGTNHCWFQFWDFLKELELTGLRMVALHSGNAKREKPSANRASIVPAGWDSLSLKYQLVITVWPDVLPLIFSNDQYVFFFLFCFFLGGLCVNSILNWRCLVQIC